MKFGMLLRFDGHTHFILSSQYSEARTLLVLFHQEKNFDVGLHSDIYRLISFNFGIIVVTTELYILIPVWMTLSFLQSHSYMRNQKLLQSFFSQLSPINADEI